jgi:DNA (cytosine-5)-methyltransferase 1
MENQDYSVGSAIIGAHSVNKPHIRKRIYWVAHSKPQQLNQQINGCGNTKTTRQTSGIDSLSREFSGIGVANSNGLRSEGQCRGGQDGVAEYSEDSRVGNTQRNGHDGNQIGRGIGESKGESRVCESERPSAESIEWLYCRDQKYRPIKSGIKPLVDGIARGVVHSCDSVITPNASAEARTVRLKGYGNAIVAPVAEEFIRATMDVINQAD